MEDAMKVKYVAKNYKISDNFKEVIERKLEKIEKYFNSDYDVKIACTEQGNDQKLEITINANGLFIRSEVTSDNMYNNIDLALPKIERQILKTTARFKNKFKRLERLEFLDEFVNDPEEKLVKVKRFDLEPVTVDMAIAQMEALEHTFYVFLNVETGLVSVVYKRADNNIGLIEVTH